MGETHIAIRPTYGARQGLPAPKRRALPAARPAQPGEDEFRGQLGAAKALVGLTGSNRGGGRVVVARGAAVDGVERVTVLDTARVVNPPVSRDVVSTYRRNAIGIGALVDVRV